MFESMRDVQMDEGLRKLLDDAKSHTMMSPKEIYEQRISWIIGQHDFDDPNPPTRAQIVQILAEQGIVDPQPN